MLLRTPTTPQRTGCPATRIGVGSDTSRYGHHGCFLRDDLQPAADELSFAESAAGYEQFRQRLLGIAARHPAVHFAVRLDAAGQYADNLLYFLGQLDGACGHPTRAIANARVTLSCGDPQRNKNYRAALFGARKSDAVEARACARFALSERPAASPPLSPPLRVLRQIAGRLQAVVRQRTRLINQLHHLLALSFPELALLLKDLSKGWVRAGVYGPRPGAATARLFRPAATPGGASGYGVPRPAQSGLVQIRVTSEWQKDQGLHRSRLNSLPTFRSPWPVHSPLRATPRLPRRTT
jgi:hypothetical protein